jgi:hypothetical protein
MTELRFECWRVSRSQLAQYLWAYDEIALSVRAFALSDATHDRVCDLTVKYRLYGIPLYRAAALAAVVVLEGRRRDLKRPRPHGMDGTKPENSAGSEDIRARLAEYSLGRSLKKREVFDGVAEMITPLLPGFRYYRSYGQYRRPFANGIALVDLGFVRGVFDGFAYKIHHRLIERAFARIFDPDGKLGKYGPTTILGDSRYHGVDWPISGSHGLELAADGIRAFVGDVVLPYLRTHEEPEAIRRTILYEHGKTPWSWPPHVTVFTIDALLGQRGWLDEDFAHYDRYYEAGPSRDSLGGHYETAKKNWAAAAPSGT